MMEGRSPRGCPPGGGRSPLGCPPGGEGFAISRRALVAFLGLLVVAPAMAQGVQLGPYKDGMFAHPRVLEERDGGAYRVHDYREGRDVNGRDEVPGRTVRSRYTSFRPRGVSGEASVHVGGRAVGYGYAGDTSSPAVIALYVHGRGGDRRQGMNDRSFGGNFNRLKNLMVRNGGLFVAPDMPDDPNAGVAAVKAILARHGASGSAVVACGSQGAAVCYGLMDDAEAANRMAGIALLGGFADGDVVRSVAVRAGRVPVVIAHGSRDTVYPVRQSEALYGALRAAGHPVRMHVFQSGIHGTPIRMLDWRETINWMLRGGRG